MTGGKDEMRYRRQILHTFQSTSAIEVEIQNKLDIRIRIGLEKSS